MAGSTTDWRVGRRSAGLRWWLKAGLAASAVAFIGVFSAVVYFGGGL